MTHPSHTGDCQHAPACSAAKGCGHGFDRVPYSWTIMGELRGAVWFALSWRHPRASVTHRSTAGEPCEGVPRFAR